MGKFSITGETVFDYPAEVVYDFVSNPHNWGKTYKGSAGMQDRNLKVPLQLGDTWTEKVTLPPNMYLSTWRLITAERPRKFAFQQTNQIGMKEDGTGGVDGFTTITYTFEDNIGEGKTLFTRNLTGELPRGVGIPDDLLTGKNLIIEVLTPSAEMDEKTGSGENWSRVADIFARVANEKDPLSANGRGNKEMLDVVDAVLPLSNASYILDVGSGPGQVLKGVLGSKGASQIPKDARIVATDIAEAFVKMLLDERQKKVEAGENIWKRVEVTQWDARQLAEVGDNEVSHLLAGHCYVAMKDEGQGLKQALRVLKPGGLFVETSLGDTEWAHLPAFVSEVRPEKKAHSLSENAQSWWTAESVKKKLTDIGFKNVQAKEYPVSMLMQSYEEVMVFIWEGFPFMNSFTEDMSAAEIARAKELTMKYLKEKHPSEPLRLQGTDEKQEVMRVPEDSGFSVKYRPKSVAVINLDQQTVTAVAGPSPYVRAALRSLGRTGEPLFGPNEGFQEKHGNVA
ncbi:hypothetical protein PRZ48_007953 [Zasmidium cellare]|uniref:Methyltransferase type 11 domain-containing protein n=1 Tax=Zasmidium cellare TaxID=395010 RepID=A0ABR0EE74_ZASCE|nr:hypothetical protein PRZ48_007953 [Zasmidium cellare]